MVNDLINRAYTIQDVAKRINTGVGTIRQWEKDLKGLLTIPRSKQGARFYTEKEISMLEKIKDMRAKNLSKEMIRMILEKNSEESEAAAGPVETLLPEKAATELKTSPTETEVTDFEKFYSAMELYKKDLLTDIKQVMQTNVQSMMDELKNDIYQGSLDTVQSVSKSIHRSNEKRKEEINRLTDTIINTHELTSETYGTLTTSITKASEETIERLSKKITRSSKDYNNTMSKAAMTVKEAHKEIQNVSNVFHDEQEHFVETMTQNLKELTFAIRDREDAFQDMVSSFRKAAAGKDKKSWWKLFGAKPIKK